MASGIAKPCIHKAAGSGINEMIFANLSWTYVDYLFIDCLMASGNKRSLYP